VLVPIGGKWRSGKAYGVMPALFSYDMQQLYPGICCATGLRMTVAGSRYWCYATASAIAAYDGVLTPFNGQRRSNGLRCREGSRFLLIGGFYTPDARLVS